MFLENGVPERLRLSTLFPAPLRAADKYLQLALDISPKIILVTQAVLLLAVACRSRILRRIGAKATAFFKKAPEDG